MKYRKKPLAVEATQWWPGKGLEDELGIKCSGPLGGYYIDTLEGSLHLSPGDWIITGVKGERYPCKPDIFEATYEPVEEGAP